MFTSCLSDKLLSDKLQFVDLAKQSKFDKLKHVVAAVKSDKLQFVDLPIKTRRHQFVA